MNKGSNVPPGPSLKGGKNRMRRGGGGIFSSTAKVAPNTLKKYPARRELLPFNNISRREDLESERRGLDAEIVEKIKQITPSTSNNLRVDLESDIELLQKRIDKINELLGETITNANADNILKQHLANTRRNNRAAERMERRLQHQKTLKAIETLQYLTKKVKNQNKKTQGGKTQGGKRTRRSRK